MFASLKNKIREETGSDLSKFTAKITTGAFKRHGSSSSVNSIVSQESAPKDPSDGLSEASEESRLRRLEADFARKEKEFREVIRDRNQTIERLERERDEAQGEARNYKELLKNAQEAKQKLANHREDKQLIENLQTQELSKIKRLVLERDKELEVKSAALKEANLQLEKLRNEVGRLRRQEELLSDVQDDLESLRHGSARDLSAISSELAKSEEERRHLSDLVAVLRERTSTGKEEENSFAAERKLLEQRLEEAHLHLADIKTSWSEKIASLETQVGRLSRQAAEEGSERRRALQEKESLSEKVKQLEWELECNRLDLNNKEVRIKRLTEEVEEMSSELKKNKAENEGKLFELTERIVS